MKAKWPKEKVKICSLAAVGTAPEEYVEYKKRITRARIFMKYYSVNWNYYHQFSGHQLLYGIIILRVGWVCLYTAEERG